MPMPNGLDLFEKSPERYAGAEETSSQRDRRRVRRAPFWQHPSEA
jgi:hypothetical protein